MNKDPITTALLASLRNTTGHVIKIIISNENIPMDFLYSDEFLVWQTLDKVGLNIKKLAFTKEYEEFALDCELLSLALNEYTKSMHNISKKYNEIIEFIKNEFQASDACENDTSTALPMLKAQKEIRKYLNSNQITEFDNYMSEVGESLRKLKITFLATKINQATDRLLAYAHLEHTQKMQYIPYKQPENSEVYYIDQNFLSNYERDENLRNLVNVAKANNAIFAYSPYVMEDGIKMNPFFLKSYVDNIYSITNGVCYAVSNTSLCMFTEDISILIKRVKLWEHATKAAEEQHSYQTLLNAELYPRFGKKTPFQEKIKDPNFSGFIEYMKEDKELQKEINGIMQKDIASTLLELSSGKSPGHENDRETISLIDDICKLMNLVNFQSESPTDTKKVKSSFQDIEHLKHSWKADYLISNDDKLRVRGSVIFNLIGSKTKIIKLDEFKRKTIDLAKK